MKKTAVHQGDHLSSTEGVSGDLFTLNNPLTFKYPSLMDKTYIPGLDPHLEKEEVIVFFKLNNTLIHKKMNKNSEAYDPDWPLPVYPSPRKPVWILSELMAWQEALKNKRNRSIALEVDDEQH